MAKGKRTAYWKVVLCEDVSRLFRYGTKIEREETVLIGKEIDVDKFTTMDQVRKMADADTNFEAEGNWELSSKLSCVKFDKDFYDNEKKSYMKILCGWVEANEPLTMEWPNVRDYRAKKLRECAARLESVANMIDGMDDMTCYDRESCLSALITFLEMPDNGIRDTITSLRLNIERKKEIEAKEEHVA